jgi:uncharacterized membrane protein
MMDWGYMGSGSVVMAVVWIVGLLLVVGVLAVVVALVVPRDQPPATPGERVEPRSAAETELELRYARGEIDAAALVEARAVLRQR